MKKAFYKIFGKFICKLFDHDMPIDFNPNGNFWCWSAGAYDNYCVRCGLRWETTEKGKKALAESQKQDPRHPMFDRNYFLNK